MQWELEERPSVKGIIARLCPKYIVLQRSTIYIDHQLLLPISIILWSRVSHSLLKTLLCFLQTIHFWKNQFLCALWCLPFETEKYTFFINFEPAKQVNRLFQIPVWKKFVFLLLDKKFYLPRWATCGCLLNFIFSNQMIWASVIF